MILLPPISTRTDTLFPYPTLFLSLDFGVFGLSSGLPHVQAGAITAIGITSDQRSSIAPDIPALSENPIFRSEEHTSELQSLMRISYAVFCLKKKKTRKITQEQDTQN